MLKRLIHSFSRHKGGIVLLSGAAAVLSGVERALAGNKPSLSAKPITDEAPLVNSKQHGFRIYRSKTDLGFSYWVLQGRGNFQSFALFDSWEQAFQEAERRLAVAHRVATQPVNKKRPVLTSR